MTSSLRLDCQLCGACCCNPEINRAEGRTAYIEVTRGDELYRAHRPLLRQLAIVDDAGDWHMRLVGEEQRCIALHGEIGARVACGIYRERPRGCRRVQPGDDECIRARRRFGLPVDDVDTTA